MLATCPISAALVHRWVLREERWLLERFGDGYDAYRTRVPRYL
jgi:protein-S-isoprenylcysteine O-methyltransferase Ste14